jgi:hypothetical protein
MSFANELGDRYVAVWNERDPERRREMVSELWALDGEHLLVPPQRLAKRRPGCG